MGHSYWIKEHKSLGTARYARLTLHFCHLSCLAIFTTLMLIASVSNAAAQGSAPARAPRGEPGTGSESQVQLAQPPAPSPGYAAHHDHSAGRPGAR